MDVNEFRAAGHKVVDRLAEYFESIESKAVFPDADPKMIRGLFDEVLPEKPKSMDDVLAELEEKLLPYCTHVGHPGYMGLITPSPKVARCCSRGDAPLSLVTAEDQKSDSKAPAYYYDITWSCANLKRPRAHLAFRPEAH